MAFTWYGRDIDKSHVGQKANTTVSNVDSLSASETVGIEPGDILVRSTVDGTVKKATSVSQATSAIGAALHSHKEPTSPYYEQGDTVPVITLGDIFLRSGTDAAAGAAAGLVMSASNPAGTSALMVGGATGTSYIAMDGVTFEEDVTAGNIVRVRIRK